MQVCMCLAFVCTFPLTLEQEVILPLQSVFVSGSATASVESVYFAIYCATFVIIIAMLHTS